MTLFSLYQRFLRPVLGAAAGALVALVLYQAYEFTAPRLLAYLPVSGENGVRIELPEGQYTDDQRQAKTDEIVLHTRQLLSAAGVQ